jgi:hypothetical protein
MNTNLRNICLALAVGGALSLAACKTHDTMDDSTPPAAPVPASDSSTMPTDTSTPPMDQPTTPPADASTTP